MGLANILTLSRLLLVPVFLWVVFKDTMWTHWAAWIIFIVAALTDYYDGWVARRTKTVSNFGRIVDPVADKVLVLSALVVFVMYGLIDLWMVLIVAGRESLITSIRFAALAQDPPLVLAAERSGKQKTVSQMTAIITTLFIMGLQGTAADYPAFNQWLAGSPSVWSGLVKGFMDYVPYWSVFVATILSITSGIDFIWKNHKVFGGRS